MQKQEQEQVQAENRQAEHGMRNRLAGVCVLHGTAGRGIFPQTRENGVRNVRQNGAREDAPARRTTPTSRTFKRRPMELRNQTAIVTGASSGLGAQFSRDLVAEGMTVYGLARRKDRLQALETELDELDGDGRFIGVELDVTDEPALAEWVGGTFDGSDAAVAPAVLINNAGFGAFGAVDAFPVETWDRMVATNLSAVFYLTRLAVPLMKARDGVSHIVNISSVAGLMGNANLSAYNATKFALRGFSEALFKELRESGIRVTCLFPGSIATEFFDPLGVPVHENMMRAEDVSESVLHVLKAPDRMLINELTMRPSNPKPPSHG